MTNERFGLSVDRAIGITIEQYMFFTGERRADIGRLLGVTGQSVSSRLHGRARWTAEDLMAVAAHFGVSVDDLLPVVGVDGSWTPAPLRTGAAPASAGAASSHLRESNSRPIHYELEISQTQALSERLLLCPRDLLAVFVLIRLLTRRFYFLLASPATPARTATPAMPALAFLHPGHGEELENGKISTHHKEING